MSGVFSMLIGNLSDPCLDQSGPFIVVSNTTASFNKGDKAVFVNATDIFGKRIKLKVSCLPQTPGNRRLIQAAEVMSRCGLGPEVHGDGKCLLPDNDGLKMLNKLKEQARIHPNQGCSCYDEDGKVSVGAIDGTEQPNQDTFSDQTLLVVTACPFTLPKLMHEMPDCRRPLVVAKYIDAMAFLLRNMKRDGFVHGNIHPEHLLCDTEGGMWLTGLHSLTGPGLPPVVTPGHGNPLYNIGPWAPYKAAADAFAAGMCLLSLCMGVAHETVYAVVLEQLEPMLFPAQLDQDIHAHMHAMLYQIFVFEHLIPSGLPSEGGGYVERVCTHINTELICRARKMHPADLPGGTIRDLVRNLIRHVKDVPFIQEIRGNLRKQFAQLVEILKLITNGPSSCKRGLEQMEYSTPQPRQKKAKTH